MSVLIETKGLQKYFPVSKGFLHAVDGIDLTIERGKTLGVVGESGCGKSTLGRAILRLQDPTAGEIWYDGQDLMKLKSKQMRKVSTEMQMIFQDPYSSLNPRMSVQQLIAEPMIINHVCNGDKNALYQRVAELMDTVGLARRLQNTYPHELDGGRRQRIGIARALSVNPKFVVCDEPVSALDVSIQAQILNLLMDLQDDMGLTYMFITHDLSVVKHISDEIMVMYLGKCIERCPSKELFEAPLHPYTQALLKAIPVPDIHHCQSVDVIRGEVVSPVNPKPGCRFASRCPIAQENCTGEDIPLKEVSPGHFVACRRCPGQ